ncbi:MAG: MBL fold metallo-hydrolase [Clostridiales bacterium]|nr:MBL fold metallo-hydrolase [Clostridiales bacterium]
MKRELIAETEQYACYCQPVLFGGTNCYLLIDKAGGEAALIDPGSNAANLIQAFDELDARPKLIINTHGHWDHIGANKRLQQHYGLDIAIHAADAPMLTDSAKNAARLFRGDGDGGIAARLLKEGDIIELGQLKLQVLHTPGHTPGCICLKMDTLLFTGDTLFNLSIGRTDLPGGDYETICQSLARLITLDDGLTVLPGHGPKGNLGHEKKHNPYLRD